MPPRRRTTAGRRLQVDDGQPRLHQGDRTNRRLAGPVGPAMGECAGQCRQHDGPGRRRIGRCEYAGDATHQAGNRTGDVPCRRLDSTGGRQCLAAARHAQPGSAQGGAGLVLPGRIPPGWRKTAWSCGLPGARPANRLERWEKYHRLCLPAGWASLPRTPAPFPSRPRHASLTARKSGRETAGRPVCLPQRPSKGASCPARNTS